MSKSWNTDDEEEEDPNFQPGSSSASAAAPVRPVEVLAKPVIGKALTPPYFLPPESVYAPDFESLPGGLDDKGRFIRHSCSKYKGGGRGY